MRSRVRDLGYSIRSTTVPSCTVLDPAGSCTSSSSCSVQQGEVSDEAMLLMVLEVEGDTTATTTAPAPATALAGGGISCGSEDIVLYMVPYLSLLTHYHSVATSNNNNNNNRRIGIDVNVLDHYSCYAVLRDLIAGSRYKHLDSPALGSSPRGYGVTSSASLQEPEEEEKEEEYGAVHTVHVDEGTSTYTGSYANVSVSANTVLMLDDIQDFD